MDMKDFYIITYPESKIIHSILEESDDAFHATIPGVTFKDGSTKILGKHNFLWKLENILSKYSFCTKEQREFLDSAGQKLDLKEYEVYL